MAQLPAEIKKTVDAYLSALRRHKIVIQKAILFGSYAAGNYNNFSDIDIDLVSDAFNGDRISDKDKIRSVTLSVSSAIEVMPFSPADFDPRNPFVKEILKTGIHLI